jgi:hypothetical protein
MNKWKQDEIRLPALNKYWPGFHKRKGRKHGKCFVSPLNCSNIAQNQLSPFEYSTEFNTNRELLLLILCISWAVRRNIRANFSSKPIPNLLIIKIKVFLSQQLLVKGSVANAVTNTVTRTPPIQFVVVFRCSTASISSVHHVYELRIYKINTELKYSRRLLGVITVFWFFYFHFRLT